MNFMSEHGERLIDNGYSILPIMPGSKSPGSYSRMESNRGWRPYRDWTRHCTRGTRQFEIELWKDWPDSGIGIACGSVVGIDIDIVQDVEVAKQVEALAREMLGDTPCLRIGLAPKRLLVYRAETSFSGFKPHPIEVLARGQQFVAFAIHPETGEPYYWPGESLLDVDISQLPAVTEAQCRAFAEKALTIIPEGLRPSRLSADDGSPHSAAAYQTGTYEAIEDALRYIPNPDLPYDDWIRIGMAIRGGLGDIGFPLFDDWSAKAPKNNSDFTFKTWNGFKNVRSIGAGTIYYLAEQNGWICPAHMAMNGAYPEWEPGHHPAQEFLDRIAAEQTPIEEIGKNIFLPDVTKIGGVLGDFIEYTVNSAMRPQPVLALAAGIALIGVVAGRRYQSPTKLRTNVYVIGMAESGGGKDHARKCILECLSQAGLMELVGGNRIASGAGLLTALTRQPASIFQLDEFGQFLLSALDRRAPKHIADVWHYLTELYTSSGTLMTGAEYANQKERPREDISEPCCVVHATTVPTPFWKALESGSLSDGSLARWLVFPSDNPIPDPVHEPADSSDIPARLLLGIQAIAAGPDGWNGNAMAFGAVGDPNPYRVPYDDKASSWLRNYLGDITKRQRAAIGTAQSATLARLFEHVVKLALIKAISDNPLQPVIDMECVTWAHGIVEFCVHVALQDADRFVADNETEATSKRILEIIRKAGKEGIKQSEIFRQARWIKKRDLVDVISSLIEAELIVGVSEPTGGRPATVYFCTGNKT